jgi:hypothetical protein
MLKRGEELARRREQGRISGIARRLRELMSDASVEVEGSSIVVSGRSLARRWLSDPELRFLSRGQP